MQHLVHVIPYVVQHLIYAIPTCTEKKTFAFCNHILILISYVVHVINYVVLVLATSRARARAKI